MPKCLRCHAGAEWIQGRVPDEPPADEPISDAEVVRRCNELATLFYKAHGYQVEEGYKMYEATHPQEVGMWNLAAMAFEFIEGTEVEQALAEIDDENA